MDQPSFRPEAPAITRITSPETPGRIPDPGTPKAAKIAAAAAFLFILVVAIIQQVGWSPIKEAAKAPVAATTVEPPEVLFEVMSRIYVKLNEVLRQEANGATPSTAVAEGAVPALTDMAETPADTIRVAITEAELGKPEAAAKRLLETQKTLGADSPLAEDLDDLIELYRPPAEGAPQPVLDPLAASRLEANHGWFGKLAAAFGKPASDPVRIETVGGGKALLLFLVCFGAAVVLAILAGAVLLIIGIVLASSGRLKLRFVPPAPGGSVAIETVAIFAAGFIVMKVGGDVIAKLLGDPQKALVAILALQWALALVIFWPAARGVKAREGLALFGIHRGRGVLREIGCGILGYLACLPLFLLGALVTFLLMLVIGLVQQWMGSKPEKLENGVIDLVGKQGHTIVAVLLFALAAIWAPLVEETIFRGALYRHLRGRWAWFAAAAVTALAFGAMHGYSIPLLFPIMGLGLGFCLLREWRGSTIASMTAHCLHNSAALTLMLVTTRLLGM